MSFIPSATPSESKSPWISPETGDQIKKQVDTTVLFMASGGVATAIIAAIGVSMSLSVGLTLGLGLGPVIWLGSQGLRALILNLFQACFPGRSIIRNSVIKALVYLASILITVSAAFFIINAVIGTVHLLPFIGVTALTVGFASVVLASWLPKPSQIGSFVKSLVSSNEAEQPDPILNCT